MTRLIDRGLGLVERVARGARGKLRTRLRRPAGAGNATPNGPDEWEAVYMRPVEPVGELASPIARAVADLTAPGDVLLEAGCGSGTLSAELARAGRVIELCDFSQRILDRAAEVFRVSGLPAPVCRQANLTRPMPLPDGAVDVVWSSGVLEHWTDEELAPIVGEMSRVSRKAVISLVPNARCVLYRFGKFVMEAEGTWPYGRELPRESLRHVFEAAGLERIEESTIGQMDPAAFLGNIHPFAERWARQWLSALPAADPVLSGQGYLLLTVGYKK